ncbi:MAG: molybdenum cofactor biosynthesis protein MoaE [Desulfofustis sp.]
MINITVLFFATFRDKVGSNRIDLEIPEGTTIEGLQDILVEKYPGLESFAHHALASVEKEYAFPDAVIPDGSEVAFFPPVAGGTEPPSVFSITDDEIDLNDLLEAITLPSTGASCIFTGMVRAVTTRDDPHETEYLEYEAYIPMAEEKMHQVANEIRQRWPSVEGVAIVQRIGRLMPGTPTVLIACTAGHRDTGVFEAARYGIDRLKQIVPIWKKEVGPEGEEWVEGDYFPAAGE